MATFRRVSRSLDALLAEINAVAPDRSKVSDGALGDQAHAARTSDHNPDANGIVHARDFTHDPEHFNSYEFARWLARKRYSWVKYIISAGEIWTPAAGWHQYDGINGHYHHVHVSVNDDTFRDWGWKHAVPEAQPQTPTVNGVPVDTMIAATLFVAELYRTYSTKPSDVAGFDYWMGLIVYHGVPAKDVRTTFIQALKAAGQLKP